MKISDYVKKEYQNIKERPPKERWAYFLEYYKWHAIIVLLVIAILIQGVVGVITRKETVLSGILISCRLDCNDDAFLQGFYEKSNVDTREQEVSFYTDLTLVDGQSRYDVSSFQSVLASVAAQQTDFITGRPDAFRFFAYSTSRIFADLRNVLDEETLNQLSDRLYYIDNAFLKQLDAPVGTEVNVDLSNCPDPRRPEAMEQPIPVGIDISSCQDFISSYYFPNTTMYLGVVSNTTRPDMVMKFIDYLLS